jgi:HSP20 family protein
MDVHYDKDTNNVNVTFELPGLQKEDVSIDVHNNVLTVSGEDKTSSERSEGGYVIRERRYGKFSRSLSLPEGLKVGTSVIPVWYYGSGNTDLWLSVQNEDIKASMANGVLNIIFPKSTPDTEPKKVTIA